MLGKGVGRSVTGIDGPSAWYGSKRIGSAIRMVQYFINRGGKNLSAARKRELEKAKKILQQKNRKERSRSPAT